jgi:hypothetical protein
VHEVQVPTVAINTEEGGSSKLVGELVTGDLVAGAVRISVKRRELVDSKFQEQRQDAELVHLVTE